MVKDFENGSREKKLQSSKLPTRWRQGHCHTLVRVSHGYVGHLSASEQDLDNYKKRMNELSTSGFNSPAWLSLCDTGWWNVKAYSGDD